MKLAATYPLRRLRSFVRRNSRSTPGQSRACLDWQPVYGLAVSDGLINYAEQFGREAPCYLEIGFGTGQSLLALAAERPECNFIAIETHRPGIGALLLGMERQGLTNIRIYEADAIEVLQQCIPDNSLAGAQLFFPDPWPKRRHHPRRIVQTPFIELLAKKLRPDSTLDVATDWDDYADHMAQVFTTVPALVNTVGEKLYAERSPRRPVLTKFEQRALRAGRRIWEFSYQVAAKDSMV